MSTVIVVTPIIVANWPVITAAVTAAVAGAGFAIADTANSSRRGRVEGREGSRVEIEVEDSEILAEAGGTGEELVVERDGVRATFRRDARGALTVCMEGQGHSKGALRQMGEELMQRVTQQYVYHRVVSELKQRNMTIVDEEVTADRAVRIRVRNW